MQRFPSGELVRQSENEKWIELHFAFTPPISGFLRSGADYRSWAVLTVNTPTMLRAMPDLLGNVIFASEATPYFDGKVEQPTVRKIITFVFSRAALSANWERIRADFDRIVGEITKESELIREDNLARGDFVRSVTVSATKRDGYWQSHPGSLKSRLTPDDPAEYWPTKPDSNQNFITETARYPWMPVDISSEEVPF